MEPTTNADQFLIEQIKAGSPSAWRELIDRYSGRLLAFARSRAPSFSDAEDLVQEALVGFLQSLAHYDPARSLETYLFTILRYKLYDVLRQKRPANIAGPDELTDWWEQVLPASTESPSKAAALHEATVQQEELLADLLRQLIHEARDRGAFDDLQVIELVFYAGKRNIDVGELLDIDQKAVAGIKFRAIQKLQSFLAERDPGAIACLEDDAEVTVARVWREHRLTCLKRSTLGSYALGVLDEPWKSYTQFHLDVVACPMCLANLADLEAEEDSRPPADTDAMFQSSIGFLKKSAT
jgi:RNA polymerase sigma-70 factor, ECF subfamily